MAMYNTYSHRVQLMPKFIITLVFSCVPLIKLVGCFRVHRQHMLIMYLSIAHVHSLMGIKCSPTNHVMHNFVSKHYNQIKNIEG